ncbi:MAG: hypothetical protein IKK09_10515 [Clostridia bacterium]|nr:hypothetical protein [Clostridia bacterium]
MKAMTVNLKEFSLPLDRIKDEAALHRRLILLYAVFTGGCFAGAVLYSNSAQMLSEYIKTLLERMLEASFPQNLRIISAVCLVPQVITALCSFSALGLPFILLCPAVCSMALSAFISYLYCNFGVDGAVFSLILLLPCAVVFFVMLLIGGNEGLILSEIVAGSVFSSKKQGRGELKGFLLRFVIIIVVCFAVAALQAVCISKFGKALLF